MRPANDNPTEVLLTLDRELDHEVAFQQVRIPDVQELRDAFERALPRVKEILDLNHL